MKVSPVYAVIIFLATLVAVVVLEIMPDVDSGPVIAFAGPVIAAIFIVGHTSKVTDEQNEVIEEVRATASTIERQTNGVLDARIRAQTLAALREAGVTSAAATITDDAAAAAAHERTPAHEAAE